MALGGYFGEFVYQRFGVLVVGVRAESLVSKLLHSEVMRR